MAKSAVLCYHTYVWDGKIKRAHFILQAEDHWSETPAWKNLFLNTWLNHCTDSQLIFSPPARLIISPSGLLQPRRLPTSHFCIYFADVWYSSDRLHYFFFPSPADESYSSCLHSAKMENWQQMLRLWRESRLRNASAYFDCQRNIHWKIPRAAVLFPALAAPNMFEKSPTAFLKGACVTSPSTSK